MGVGLGAVSQQPVMVNQPPQAEGAGNLWLGRIFRKRLGCKGWFGVPVICGVDGWWEWEGGKGMEELQNGGKEGFGERWGGLEDVGCLQGWDGGGGGGQGVLHRERQGMQRWSAEGQG